MHEGTASISEGHGENELAGSVAVTEGSEGMPRPCDAVPGAADTEGMSSASAGMEGSVSHAALAAGYVLLAGADGSHESIAAGLAWGEGLSHDVALGTLPDDDLSDEHTVHPDNGGESTQTEPDSSQSHTVGRRGKQTTLKQWLKN